MSRYIEVTLVIEIPDDVDDEDIRDFVDVTFGECNSMRKENPLPNSYEVIEHYWREEL